MEILSTGYLNVFYDKKNDLFVQNWLKSPETNTIFKREMTLFVNQYKVYQPSKSLWLHKNFSFKMNSEITNWTEENVIKECVKAGNKKLAFVLGKDVLSHVSVSESFNGIAITKPKHFFNKKDALKWLLEDYLEIENNQPPYIHYEGVDTNGDIILKIKKTNNTIGTINLFKEIKEKYSISNKDIKRFNSLTFREKEVLLQSNNGKTIKEIACNLNLSIYTVRTHWRNIKKKLQIHSFVDALKYKEMF